VGICEENARRVEESASGEQESKSVDVDEVSQDESKPLEVDAVSEEVGKEDFMEMYEESFRRVEEGQVVQGRIVEINEEFALVDIGYQSEGQVPIIELTGPDGSMSAEEGDTIAFMVERWDDDDGVVQLSKEKATDIKAWDVIQQAYERDVVISGVITGRIERGFSVDACRPAVWPVSQRNLRQMQNHEEMVGKTLDFKVQGFDRRRGDIYLSRPSSVEGESADFDDCVPYVNLCLTLTHAATKQMCEIGEETGTFPHSDEDGSTQAAYEVVRSLLGTEPLYCYLRNGGKGQQGDTFVDVILATDTDDQRNDELIKKLSEKTIAFRGVQKREGSGDYVVVSARLNNKTEGRYNAYCIPALTRLVGRDRTSHFETFGLPEHVVEKIECFPTPRDHQKTVEGRLEDWQRFLEVSEQIAKSKQFSVEYEGYSTGRRPHLLEFHLREAGRSQGMPWARIEAAFRKEIELKTETKDSDNESDNSVSLLVGDLESFSEDELTLTIRLNPDMQERLRDIKRLIPQRGILSYTAGGDIGEIRRRRTGLRRLARGDVQNPNLSEFLFDASCANMPEPGEEISLSKDEFLLPSLNDEQQNAVAGAISCPDLYLVKGPPGTGKTTVIAEMCYQLARRGKRTLIASQTNLAVDNALQRLVHDTSIRALRLGREGGIEEEGLPFIESRVIGTWLSRTAEHCERQWDNIRCAIQAFELAAPIERELREYVRDLETKETLEKEIEAQIKDKEPKVGPIQKQIKELEHGIRQNEANSAAISRMAKVVHGKDASNKLSNEPDWTYDAVATNENFLRYVSRLSEIQKVVDSLAGSDVMPSDDIQGSKDSKSDIVGAYELGLSTDQAVKTLDTKYSIVLPLLAAVEEKLEHYSQVFEDIANTVNSLDQIKAKFENRLVKEENINRRIAEMEAGIIEYSQLLRELKDMPAPVFDQWEKDLAEDVFERFGLRYRTYPMDLIPQPDFPSDLISTKSMSTLWKAAVEEMRDDYAGLFEQFRLAVDDENTCKRLNRLKEYCDKAIRSFETKLDRGQVSPVMKHGSIDQEAFKDILAIGPDGKRWQLKPKFMKRVTKICRGYSTGDKGSRLVDAFVGKISSRRKYERQAKRWNEGLATFRQLRRAVGKAHDDMTNVFSEDKAQLSDTGKTMTKMVRQTLVNVAQDAIGEKTDQVKEKERQLNNVEGKVERDRNELEDGEKRLVQLRETGDSGALEIREAVSSLGDVSKYPPLSETTQLVERILDSATPGALVKQWGRTYLNIKDKVGFLKPDDDLFGDLDLCFKDVFAELGQSRVELIQEKESKESVLLEWAREIEELEKQSEDHCEKIDERRRWWGKAFPQIHRQTEGALIDFEEGSADIHSLDFARTMLRSIQQTIEDGPQTRLFLERYEKIAKDWTDRIRNQDSKDHKDLRISYITNANVIGTTCSKAGQLSFCQEYGPFDMVIVDEVSKATPPELLLPMLLGKKVVLIGDDKQLPPMVGPDSLRALADESGCSEEEISHLKGTLFSELWQSAPDNLKTMLILQYRMHPTIMNVINQFYDYRLECAIENPDVERAHGCGGPRIPENCHAVWVDVPSQERFREERVGTSKANMAEIDVIEAIVKDLNNSWGVRVKNGEKPKQVGIITFYAAQARRLEDRFLDNGNLYPNLVFRIGTVNRFQGMERPVVIVSMVRNNGRRQIGFARDPELVNVGLSRAQELLIMVGCATLFCAETHSSSAMRIYKNVEAVIGHEGELTDVWQFIDN
jgi:hypothetical protein